MEESREVDCRGVVEELGCRGAEETRELNCEGEEESRELDCRGVGAEESR